jgi:hypothetical protein
MPPADFCSSASPEHTSDPSKPHHLVRRQAAAWRVAAPLAGPHQPRCLRPGVALAFRPFRPPPRRPLAAQDLPQPDCLGHPLSQPRAVVYLKDQHTPAAVRLRPLSNGIAQQASPKCHLPCRAASCALPRKSSHSAAPRVPSIASASRCRKAAASSPRRISGTQPTDAFVTNINTLPDGAGISLARPPGAFQDRNPTPRGDRSALDDFCVWNSS